MPSHAITTRAESAKWPRGVSQQEPKAWDTESDAESFTQNQEFAVWNYELTESPIPFSLPAFDSRILLGVLSANRIYELSKRGLDITVSLLVLLLALPLLILVVILIKATSPGPIIFKQKRLGLGGKEFLCFKFRTMNLDAEERLNQDPALREQFQESYKIKNDPRMTAVGSLLRKTSIDEMPQLFNVLSGEMSLIGPRPIVKPELSKYSIYGNKLLSVKPGLGGIWQVCGRSDVAYPERVLMDMHYVDHRCLLLDLYLMLLTPVAIVRGHGAW
jgi:lipopolysaccharide/colanic/teichoic acid biosynthesis glycosyltransferase